jgi:hypothetical protein
MATSVSEMTWPR